MISDIHSREDVTGCSFIREYQHYNLFLRYRTEDTTYTYGTKISLKYVSATINYGYNSIVR